MGVLTKSFKSVAGLIGEVLVAGTGIAVIYGIGIVSGAKQGSKVSSLIDDIRDKINNPPAEEAEEETVDEAVTEDEEDADEDETPGIEVSITPPEE